MVRLDINRINYPNYNSEKNEINRINSKKLQFDTCSFKGNDVDNNLNKKDKTLLNLKLLKKGFDNSQRKTILILANKNNIDSLEILLKAMEEKNKIYNEFNPKYRFSASNIVSFFNVLNNDNKDYLKLLLTKKENDEGLHPNLIYCLLQSIPEHKKYFDDIQKVNAELINPLSKETIVDRFSMTETYDLINDVDKQNEDLFYLLLNSKVGDEFRFSGNDINNLISIENLNRDASNPDVFKDFVKKIVNLKDNDDSFIFTGNQVKELIDVSSYRENFILDLLEYKKEDGKNLFGVNKIIYLADSCNPDFKHYVFGMNGPTKKSRYLNGAKGYNFEPNEQNFLKKNIDYKKKVISRLIVKHKDNLDDKNINKIANIAAEINYFNHDHANKLINYSRLSLDTIGIAINKYHREKIDEIYSLIESKVDNDFRFSDDELQSVLSVLNTTNFIALQDILDAKKDGGKQYKTEEIINILDKLSHAAEYKLENAKKNPPRDDEPYFITVSKNIHSYMYDIDLPSRHCNDHDWDPPSQRCTEFDEYSNKFDCF
jgi:hypothetical protein